MVYKWGHPVATLPSDGGYCISLSQNDVNYANQLAHLMLAVSISICCVRGRWTMHLMFPDFVENNVCKLIAVYSPQRTDMP
eukprot:3477044-Pleurochrysis_carterae.AAC.2